MADKDDEDETYGLKKFIFSPELLERTTPRSYRKRSLWFRYRLRVFCGLHRPITLKSQLYHYFFFFVVFLSSVVFNVFDRWFYPNAVYLMTTTDVLLTLMLTTELFFRLWSSECMTDYSGCKGKFSYFRDYCPLRLLDLIGIATFASFIYYQELGKGDLVATVIRLCHVFQLCQVYRIMLPVIKLITNTLYVQFFQLYVALVFLTILISFMSFSVYLKEMPTWTITDSFWFTYVTLATIGYGDLVPNTLWGKVLTCVIAFIGISAFQLPANIFGTGLAIKLRDKQKKILFQSPAANLIQTFWRCHSTDRDSNHISVWKLFKKDGQINDIDKQCIRFILKYRYLRARRHFKSMTGPKKFVDDSEEQLDLLQKLSFIENALIDLKDEIHDLRLEYEALLNNLDQIVKSFDTN